MAAVRPVAAAAASALRVVPPRPMARRACRSRAGRAVDGGTPWPAGSWNHCLLVRRRDPSNQGLYSEPFQSEKQILFCSSIANNSILVLVFIV